MDRDPPGVPPTLDDAQQALWASAPDVPRRAVDAVVAELGPLFPDEILLRTAAHATVEAAATFDRERGLAYAQWAFLFTSYRLWEQIRRAHGGDAPMLARIRLALFQFMAHHQRLLDVWTSTREKSRAALQSFSDAFLFSAALTMGARVITRGEEDVVETEGARRAGEAVRKVVGGLRPEQRALLERCFADGESVARAAKNAKRPYRTFLEDYHDLLALCGARLAGLDVKKMPPWSRDVSGQVFDDAPESSSD